MYWPPNRYLEKKISIHFLKTTKNFNIPGVSLVGQQNLKF
jgi:hypothetical protein